MAQAPVVDRAMVHGAPVLTLEDHSFELVRFVVAVRLGAVTDPQGLGGAMHIMLELLLRGTQAQDRRKFNAALEELGSAVDTSAGNEMAVLRGITLKRHLQATWSKATEALCSPRFAPDEFKRLVDETIDGLHIERDDDDSVADHFLRQHLYPAPHPLGRSPGGSVPDLQALTLDDVHKAYGTLNAANMVVAFAGDITPEQSERLSAPLLKHFSGRPATRLRIDPPKPFEQLKVVVVDKPDRTQVQLRLGQVTLPGMAPDVEAFWLGITAFGGTFTSPFTREVRDVRGWSYVAHADFRRRALFAAPVVLRSAPALGDAVACLELELSLYDDLCAGKLSVETVVSTRHYLLNRYPFEVATAFDMLGAALSHELLGLPIEQIVSFPERLQALDATSIPQVVAQHLKRRQAVALLVAPAAAVVGLLRERFGASAVNVVDFRDGLGLKQQS